MKKLFLVSIILIITIMSSSSQDGTPWFSVRELQQGVWVISDHGADNMYLVEGTDSSMLIDTGLGAADISAFVKKLTSKPLIVVNTHGHPDHSGGNYQFESVYIHPADITAARAFNGSDAREGSSQAMLQENRPAENERFRGKPFDTRILPLREGRIFRLGERNLRVIGAPGHTPGEICLLDVENKLLFTGDNSNTLVWLFLANCRPLHEYLVTLEKLASMSSDYTTIMPGHGAPLPADFINDQIECVKGILNKSLEAKPYQSFAGNAMVSTYGRSSVAFNPDNL